MVLEAEGGKASWEKELLPSLGFVRAKKGPLPQTEEG